MYVDAKIKQLIMNASSTLASPTDRNSPLAVDLSTDVCWCDCVTDDLVVRLVCAVGAVAYFAGDQVQAVSTALLAACWAEVRRP